jgi:hypothetical protein
MFHLHHLDVSTPDTEITEGRQVNCYLRGGGARNCQGPGAGEAKTQLGFIGLGKIKETLILPSTKSFEHFT